MSVSLSEHLPLLAEAPDGIKKLRGLILELAVRGKLVPQDPGDEPASELLKRIQAEKAKLVAEGKIKKDKPLPAIGDDEKPFELPDGWEWTRLGDVVELLDSLRKPVTKHDREPGPYPYYGASGVVDYVSNYIFDEPLVLVGEDGAKWGAGENTAFPISGKTWVNNHAHVLRPDRSVLIDQFVVYTLVGMNLQKFITGMTVPKLNQARLVSIFLPIPPLAEQHRIVAKVDELMALCDRLEAQQTDAATAHATLVKTLLDTLAQSPSAADFAADWQRIARHFDTLFTTEASIDVLKQTVLQLATTGAFASAHERAGWREGTLSDVVVRSEAGWSPQCENRPRDSDEWGVLKVSAVSWDEFDPGQNKALPKSLDARPEFEVKPGDFLISRANTADLVAKSVVVRDAPARLMLSDKTIRLHFVHHANPDYFCMANNAPVARRYYAQIAGGTSSSMKNVSRQQILGLPVLIPPVDEQHRIVAKVDEIMTLCDRLKVDLAESRARQARLAATLIESALQAA